VDTAWIQVFVLSFVECVAPVGKSVCQQQQFELEFLTRRDCEYAMQQMIDVKDQLDYVIVDRALTRCAAVAREAETYTDADAIQTASGTDPVITSAGVNDRRTVVNTAHNERLQQLKSCEETNGSAPCTIGDIIVEEATGDSVEVWRRD